MELFNRLARKTYQNRSTKNLEALLVFDASGSLIDVFPIAHTDRERYAIKRALENLVRPSFISRIWRVL